MIHQRVLNYNIAPIFQKEFMRYSLIFIFSLPFFLCAQTAYNFKFGGEILYKVTFQTDTLEGEVYEEVAELLYNDTVSLFRSLNTGKRDSARQEHIKMGEYSYPIAFAMQTFSRLTFQIINYGDKLHTLDAIRVGSVFVPYKYEEPTDVMQWELCDDVEVISGFACQRATLDFGGRQWIAWFTDEIPINIGPYKFSKLPGLIVSIKDQSETWKIDLLSINNDKPRNISIDNYIHEPRLEVSKKKFFETRREAQENGLMYTIAGIDDYDSLPEKYKKRLRDAAEERKKSDNNWIESLE